MKDHPPHIVIIRLSALGDIAISAPLVREYALKNPNVRFTMVSHGFTEPLFAGINNLHFFPVNVKKEGTVKGLWRIAGQLAKLNPTIVADLHSVIGSRLLKSFLWLRGIPFKTINKNRKARRALVNHLPDKELAVLKPVCQLYEDVLVKCGLENLSFASIEPNDKIRAEIKARRAAYLTELCSRRGELQNETLTGYIKMPGFKIGIAPFAKHAGKRWPGKFVEQVIYDLSKDPNTKVFLFGGIEEERVLMGWEQKYQNTFTCAGKFKFAEELLMMNELDVMLSMDSANMHLASFVGTKVVSVWGATHPAAGFYGWMQDPYNALQADMPCRPCSIYGNKPCKFGDFRCLSAVTPEVVEGKILEGYIV